MPAPSSSISPTTHSTSTPHSHDPKAFGFVWRSFLAGGIAGCSAKTVVAPLDRVKILFQTESPAYRSSFGVVRTVREIYSNFGIRGLLQGHSATLLRIFPYAAVKFMSYEQYKHIFALKSYPSLTHFFAGSMAGITSVFATYPLELIRVHLAYYPEPIPLSKVIHSISTTPTASSSSQTSTTPIPPRSGVAPFYRGFNATVCGMIPYAGVSFFVYERMKKYHPHSHSWLLLTGGVAGIVSQTLSYPFEVVRRRIQIGRYTTMRDTFTDIYRRHGWRGFYVGLSIGYLKVAPMSMVSFWTYELCKRLFKISSPM
ncbi:hypothetical protein HMI54_009821 [Coelomomyces lativittatus]|nr:hypothetical protein HMI56_004335 [Coelomomyces lativittatus]KAJ1501623.1 hypothetical protein HMI54_009821 [Coelomomyces lativittatus]KAJ1501665.1 hypothetical protein HMI55_003276 [Coelomomyces lativittatus]